MVPSRQVNCRSSKSICPTIIFEQRFNKFVAVFPNPKRRNSGKDHRRDKRRDGRPFRIHAPEPGANLRVRRRFSNCLVVRIIHYHPRSVGITAHVSLSFIALPPLVRLDEQRPRVHPITVAKEELSSGTDSFRMMTHVQQTPPKVRPAALVTRRRLRKIKLTYLENVAWNVRRATSQS